MTVLRSCFRRHSIWLYLIFLSASSGSSLNSEKSKICLLLGGCNSANGPQCHFSGSVEWALLKDFLWLRECHMIFIFLFSSWQVHEAVPCYSECDQYSWVVEHWSPCKINSELRSPRCGRGTQSRRIRYVTLKEWSICALHKNTSFVIQVHDGIYILRARLQNCSLPTMWMVSVIYHPHLYYFLIILEPVHFMEQTTVLALTPSQPLLTFLISALWLVYLMDLNLFGDAITN